MQSKISKERTIISEKLLNLKSKDLKAITIIIHSLSKNTSLAVRSGSFTKYKLLNLEEISFLLWATQGIRQAAGSGTTLKTVPSAGARHSFETYLEVLTAKRIIQVFAR